MLFCGIGLSLLNPATQSLKHKVLTGNLTAPLLSCLILFALLAGCGGQTKILKSPVEISKTVSPKKAAIFPLADYSQRKPFVESYRHPNLLIIEEITQNLVGYGFNISIQEDVNEVLISEKVLMPVPVEAPLPVETLSKLANFNRDTYGRWGGTFYNPSHLQEMEETELIEKLNKELETKVKSLQPQGVKGLDQETVTKLAEKLDVDIVFRGRILEYGFKGNDTLNPIEGAGLLTFLIDEPKRFIFGVTNQDKYDKGLSLELFRDAVESAVIGGAIGGGIGAAASAGETGALIGAGLGLLRTGEKPPVESTVMHIRLYAQDGKTGKIIWTNAIEVEREPTSRFAFDEKHPKVLLDKLTREGTERLVDDFIKNTGFAKLKVREKEQSQEEPLPEESQQQPL